MIKDKVSYTYCNIEVHEPAGTEVRCPDCREWCTTENETEVKVCPKCRVVYIEKEQKDFIEQIGMCASCDHIATDLTAEEQYAN
jgi:hypothetical protein